MERLTQSQAVLNGRPAPGLALGRFASWPGRRHLDGMPAPITISRLRPILAERGRGIMLVEALFSDNRTVRFRVLSRDPAAVQAVADEALPEHEKAVERWLDAHSGRRSA